MPRFRDITLPLTGLDSSAEAILDRADRALSTAGLGHLYPKYLEEATCWDYQTMIDATRRWFRTE